MSKEAMKLALEALENSVDLVVEDAYNAEKLYGNYPTRQAKVGGLKVLAENHKEAIKALEVALAKQEQGEPLPDFYITERTADSIYKLKSRDWALCISGNKGPTMHKNIPVFVGYVKTKLVEQEQGEPVTADEKLARMKSELAYMRGQQEQGEPVAWIQSDEVHISLWKDDYHTIPLYTTPQQRKPLMLEKFREMEALLDDNPHQHKKMFMDDELKIIMETTMPVIDWKARYGVELNNGERNKWMLEWFIAFARAIEAAHGIKE